MQSKSTWRNAIGFGYLALALVAFFLLQDLRDPAHRQTILYSEFKQLLKAGDVRAVSIEDGVITGRVRVDPLRRILPADRVAALGPDRGGEHAFVTVAVDDPRLVADLEGAGVKFGRKPSSKWLSNLVGLVAPVLLFAFLWFVLMRRMSAGMGGMHGGLMEIGKSKARVYMEKATGIGFADVAGIDEAKEELMEVVDFLKSPDRYRRLGGKIPKGVLIVGAPGTGKTLLAKAVAGEAGVPFLSLSGSEFVEMFVGVGAARVRDLFDQAEERAPCIIFIDELDALGKARGFSVLGGHDEREQTLNQLLVEMDGFDTNKGVIIMAATNRPEILDPALLRPGRFDRHVAIDKPDIKGRLEILRVHTRTVRLAEDVSLEAVAGRTPGFAGADLANLVNEAALRAAKRERDAVAKQDFDEALDRIVVGLERKNRVINPQEKQTIAYHEAGHALIAETRAGADKIAKVSIIPRGIAALGFTQQQPTEDRYVMRRSELLDRLDVLLGGRVAEELVFQDVSTGAQDDLQRATDLARHMVTHYGMSDVLGPVAHEAPPTPVFLGTPQLPESPKYSEHTARLIDAEVRRLVEEARGRVTATLAARRETLEAIARLLLEKEVIDREALDALMQPAASGRMTA
ncbi:MAG: ATP-dependent zinc metalloprotease FtsH [Pseudomonadota bacterium]